MKNLIPILFLLLSARVFAGTYDEHEVLNLNRSHLFFNALRVGGSYAMTLSLPYYFIEKSVPYEERFGFGVVFPVGSLLSTFAYGRGYKESLDLEEKWKNADALWRYRVAMDVYDNENDINSVLTSAGTQAFLLGMGVLLMHLGERGSANMRLRNTYAIGLGLTVHSSWMLSVDLTEWVVRLVRRNKTIEARVRLRI